MSRLKPASLKKSYETVMEDMHYELRPSERFLSRLIHLPVLQSITSVLTGTLLRPQALIVGGVFAIITLGATYLIARLHGYEPSGLEPHMGFVIGWVCGLVYDLIHLSLPSNRHQR